MLQTKVSSFEARRAILNDSQTAKDVFDARTGAGALYSFQPRRPKNFNLLAAR
jgi:hypothetical protein